MKQYSKEVGQGNSEIQETDEQAKQKKLVEQEVKFHEQQQIAQGQFSKKVISRCTAACFEDMRRQK